MSSEIWLCTSFAHERGVSLGNIICTHTECLPYPNLDLRILLSCSPLFSLSTCCTFVSSGYIPSCDCGWILGISQTIQPSIDHYKTTGLTLNTLQPALSKGQARFHVCTTVLVWVAILTSAEASHNVEVIGRLAAVHIVGAEVPLVDAAIVATEVVHWVIITAITSTSTSINTASCIPRR